MAGLLQKVTIFKDLDEPALTDLTRRMVARKVAMHGAIVAQDEVGEALFVMLSGRAKVTLVAESGREVTLSVLRPADFFGEMSIFDGAPRSANVIALEPVTVLALAKADLMAHLRQHPTTAINLACELSKRLRRADEIIARLALQDVEGRLVAQLLELAHEDGVEIPDGMLIRRRPTQQELANMVGSCRETISRTFNLLARRGLITPRGRSLLVTRRLMEHKGETKAA
ncbi:MAG: Crp/Fnr family transcriptional regulator [Deltaproteobacteria bacterium]|nr:Crp/Fnr family transcriptional regulator [Deltaproteobacteria bacterium]